MTIETSHLPNDFFWGAASSPHQIEGNNTNTDFWAMEHALDSRLAEKSGDACDSYHRWGEDLDIVADLGLDTYRFGIEWARIEPAPREISLAALAHYRRLIEGCLARGITPVVTIHHFTSPVWFRDAGGWSANASAASFRSYASAVKPILDGVEWVCTINEPNIVALIAAAMRRERKQAVTAGALPAPDEDVTDGLIRAHREAREELSSLPGLRTGWTVANQVFQAAPELAGVPDAEAIVDAWAYPREDVFLDVAKDDDFVGVQAYMRTLIGREGSLPVPDGARTTQMGWEFYPTAVEDAIRHTAERVGATPIIVTENGIATANDDERIEYTTGAIEGVGRAVRDGIDVRGYLHWSLLDNYEWGSWHPKFGLVSVDRQTFARTVKPSGRWYGNVAAAHRSAAVKVGP